MTVTRYRDVADMPSPERGDPTDPATFKRIRDLWRSASHLPPLFRPGVYKYRSAEDSEAARNRATLERMRAVRRKRVRNPPSR